MPEEVKRPEWITNPDDTAQRWISYAMGLENRVGGLIKRVQFLTAERDALRAQAEALAEKAGELSDWLQETGRELNIVEFNRKASALHEALVAYRAGKEKS